ncbi:MAG: hypothetical protein HOO99_18415 [Hyphomicrobiaceae bacterium]|nr:hypothetical protein [Hyphomicrobiaceae bacterium]
MKANTNRLKKFFGAIKEAIVQASARIALRLLDIEHINIIDAPTLSGAILIASDIPVRAITKHKTLVLRV